MGKLYFGSWKLLTLVLPAMTLFVGCALPKITDHASFFTGSTPPDTAIYCGVGGISSGAVPMRPSYILHVSATEVVSAGRFRITFMDRDSFEFEVRAGSSNSTTHALGGVPGVDNTVKITAEGVRRMTASVETEYGAWDPFDETRGVPQAQAQSDNFCVTAPRDAGWTSAAQIIP